MSDPRGPAVELAHRDEGAGPVVLLLHGVGGDRLLWNAVAKELVPHFRVLVPDLRGHGQSPSPDGSRYDLDELLGDVLHLLDEKAIPSAHWVGLSAGAFLALRAALDHPERVRSLTMVSGGAYLDSHSKAVVERWWATSREEGAEGLAIRLLKDLYYPDWVEAHLDVVDQMHEEVPRRNYAGAVAWEKSLQGYDERNRIPTVRQPTLIVQAMDDQVVDASHGRILRQSIPGSTIRIFAQTGHLIPIERPSELAEAIAEHVRQADRDRSASG